VQLKTILKPYPKPEKAGLDKNWKYYKTIFHSNRFYGLSNALDIRLKDLIWSDFLSVFQREIKRLQNGN